MPGREAVKRSGGGDRSRTCIALRPAVFKTAAIPLCDPSAVKTRCETIAYASRLAQLIRVPINSLPPWFPPDTFLQTSHLRLGQIDFILGASFKEASLSAV